MHRRQLFTGSGLPGRIEAGQTHPTASPPRGSAKSSVGVVLVCLAMILTGCSWWGSSNKRPAPDPPVRTSTSESPTSVEGFGTFATDTTDTTAADQVTLMNYVPADLRSSCAQAQPPAGATDGLECPSETDPDLIVYYYAFPDRAAADSWVLAGSFVGSTETWDLAGQAAGTCSCGESTMRWDAWSSDVAGEIDEPYWSGADDNNWWVRNGSSIASPS